MTISVTALSPVLGARVEGLNRDNFLDPVIVERIRDALDSHLVLVIPGLEIDAPGLRDFVLQFGPPFLHHADEGVIYHNSMPEVLEMKKAPDGVRLFGGSDWHADVTFRAPEGYMSALHARQIPPSGGDTLFASSIAALSALSQGMRALLRNLSAVHSYNGRGLPDHPTETALHPVVRQHPVTGEEGLYINRMFATRFEGMTARESEPLIDFLDAHMSQPEFTCRVSWEVNQLVMWDNRFTLHYPVNDFTGHARLLLRCTALCS